ncbi:hypothetical protein CVT26_013654 [Gymnopilus dilepis]|uniref:Cytochrome P450 n=1 Tax=Gymnopilus dilepis TaxID=231916 RepID=A0A409YWI3_9AGAR|nr:hypothetical protein CVT26_013654 [Gymnopilus dilepis]
MALLAASALLVIFRSKKRFPPGPPALPLLGNILDFPKRESWKVYLDWGRAYNSDILSLKIPGTRLFVLNSAQVIQDLLVKRANNYSDRIGTSWLIPFMNNTERWRDHRRLFRREFDTPEASAVNRSHEVHAARRLLHRLLSTKDHEGDLRLAAVDTILSITYGITPTDFEHPFIKAPEDLNAIFGDVAKGGYMVDLFPFLRYLPAWLPGVKFHKLARRGRPLSSAVVLGPYQEVQNQVQKGIALPSVASKFLYELQEGSIKSSSEIEMMRNVLGNAYLGMSLKIMLFLTFKRIEFLLRRCRHDVSRISKTVCALYNFVLAMALHPEVQKKAQASLDSVLGGTRLPEFDDMTQLPYISAIVNEVLRWHPIGPLAVYHVNSRDDEYNGYFIPKGSMMIPNTWSLLHDEGTFGPNTNQFIPERFLNFDGSLNADRTNMDYAFGFGRRSCPGRLMARDTLWIMAAHILAAYDVLDPFDMEGNKLTSESDLEYTNTMVRYASNLLVGLNTLKLPTVQLPAPHEDHI